MGKIVIFTDGGARGNPGPAAIGVVVQDTTGKIIWQKGKYIGQATNNEAEYQALIEALCWLVKHQKDFDEAEFVLDSRLVASQMRREFKVKAGNLKPLFLQAKNLESKLQIPFSYTWQPRRLNRQSDRVLNRVLNLFSL